MCALPIGVVGEDGRAPGLGKALLRWVLWVLDGFPYVLPLVGGIVALTTVGHRRVGDMAAKTFVVDRGAMGSPIVVPGLTAPARTSVVSGMSVAVRVDLGGRRNIKK